jgi:putative flippase GtrA
MINSKNSVSFLIAGVVNTIFGYAAALFIYRFFYESIGLITVSILSNIISISFAFLSYKIFIFKTKGNWIKEYLRCYLVYGVSAGMSVVMIWILVKLCEFPFWFAQGLSIGIIVAFSYLAHNKFTFNSSTHISK